MDLKTLDTTTGSEKGFELELFHPSTTKPLGIFITVFGRDSAVFRDFQNEASRARMTRAAKLNSSRLNIVSLEDIEKESIRLLAACTRSWRTQTGNDLGEPVISVGGDKLTCSAANAERLYTEYPWVKEQVDAGVTDRANFLPR